MVTGLWMGQSPCLALYFGFVILRTGASQLLKFCSGKSCQTESCRRLGEAEIVQSDDKVRWQRGKWQNGAEGTPVTQRGKSRIRLPETPISRALVPMRPTLPVSVRSL